MICETEEEIELRDSSANNEGYECSIIAIFR